MFRDIKLSGYHHTAGRCGSRIELKPFWVQGPAFPTYSSLPSLFSLPVPPIALSYGWDCDHRHQGLEGEWHNMSDVGNVCRFQFVLFLLVSPTPPSESAPGLILGCLLSYIEHAF